MKAFTSAGLERAGLSIRDARLFETIIYCAKRQKQGGIAFNTYEDWTRITRLSWKQFRSALDHLLAMRLIGKTIKTDRYCRKHTGLEIIVTSYEEISVAVDEDKARYPGKRLSALSYAPLHGGHMPIDDEQNVLTGADALLYITSKNTTYSAIASMSEFPGEEVDPAPGSKVSSAQAHILLPSPSQSETIKLPVDLATVEAQGTDMPSVLETALGLKDTQATKKAKMLAPDNKTVDPKSRTGLYQLWAKLLRMETGAFYNPASSNEDKALVHVQRALLDVPEITAHELFVAVIRNWSSVMAELKSVGKAWQGSDKPALWPVCQNIGTVLTWYMAFKAHQTAPKPAPAPTPTFKLVGSVYVKPKAPVVHNQPYAGMSAAENLAFFEEALTMAPLEKAVASWVKRGFALPEKYAGAA